MLNDRNQDSKKNLIRQRNGAKEQCKNACTILQVSVKKLYKVKVGPCVAQVSKHTGKSLPLKSTASFMKGSGAVQPPKIQALPQAYSLRNRSTVSKTRKVSRTALPSRDCTYVNDLETWDAKPGRIQKQQPGWQKT